MILKQLILFCLSIAWCGNVFADNVNIGGIQQNPVTKSFLTVASFPKTISDATFVERVENAAAGYEPYFNRSAFADMTIDEQDELETMAYRAEATRQSTYANASRQIYCHLYPDDGRDCPDTETTVNEQPVVVPESVYQTVTPVTNYISNLYMNRALTPENIAKYNLDTHDGGCTPPEHSDWWRNIILTSGRYQYSAPAFEKFMITAFRKEGDCANHPDDRGGYTCFGCASRGLCAGVDLKNVTRAMVEDLTYKNYYKQYNVDKLPDAFRGYAMWGIFGSGPITGIKTFQSALGVPNTGTIDSATIRAAETYTGDFADTYTTTVEQFYRNIVARDNSQRVFLNGWLNSLKLLTPSGCHVVPTNPIYR